MSKGENSNLEFRKIKSLFFLYEINSNGTIIRNVKSKKNLKITLDMHHSKTGYYTTFVCGKRVMIHRAVAECWLGDCPSGLQVDHIDRDSKNNDYRNLRYVTHSEQMKNRILSAETIERCKRNCVEANLRISIPIEIFNQNINEREYFISMLEATRWFSKRYNKKPESIRYKLRKRRKKIYDFDISYGKTIKERNAETGHADSKE